MKRTTVFTSECVSPGHPDKICDQISDAVLDSCLQEDPASRVAVETLCTAGKVIVAGELSTAARPEIDQIVRRTIEEIGYSSDDGFDSSCEIVNLIQEQSPDIARGVETGGAGDQGLMFGGAVRETPELMPMALAVSRSLLFRLEQERQKGVFSWARPDAKSQVSLLYDEETGRITGVDAVVMSVQHIPEIECSEISHILKSEIIGPVLSEFSLNPNDVNRIYINPTGRFVKGGPAADTGLTGRKIIVDTYGGMFRHGGGAFSGKDTSKVDRSAAYAARWIAKNLIAAEVADKCEIQLSYAIGVAEPVSIKVETFGTGRVSDAEISKAVYAVFDLTPAGIESALKLRTPGFLYRDLAAFGHIGRNDIDLPWERLDRVEDLRSVVFSNFSRPIPALHS